MYYYWGGIPDEFWPEILQAITHISYLLPTLSLHGVSSFDASAQSLPNLQHLRILESTVYVFIYEEERNTKSAKQASQGKRRVLVSYNGETIYHVYLYDNDKVICIKDLKIHENVDKKEDSQVTRYDAIMAPSSNKSHSTSTSSSLSSPTLLPIISTPLLLASEITLNTNLPKKARSEHILQLPKQYNAGMNTNVKVLLFQLTEVFAVLDWGIKENYTLYSSQIDNKCDFLVFLTQKIRAKDVEDLDHYTYITNNFDIKEPETYEKVMVSEQAEKWAKVMKEEIQSLIKHETQTLIPKDKIAASHLILKRKWVYRITRDVDNQITQFKTRWVVKGYLQQAGVDFDQIFAAIVKPMIFRTLFAITTFYDLDIEQMDVKIAFLHGIIN